MYPALLYLLINVYYWVLAEMFKIRSIPHYIEEVNRFTTWCKANFLDLNLAKTKELLIDFRKQPPAVSPITIDGDILLRELRNTNILELF